MNTVQVLNLSANAPRSDCVHLGFFMDDKMSDLIEHPNGQSLPAIQSESAAVMSIIQKAASDPSVDMDKLERLMLMHERIQARNAEQEFSKCMAEMQCDIPSIAERGKGHGTIRYATLEDINDVMKPIMQKYGFAISFKVVHAQNGVSVTGILMHKAGHREETTMLLPSDTSGSKNAVQAVGSSTSYGKRYVMCALLNITTRGSDDDGYAAAPTANVSAAQAAQLQAMLSKCSERAREAFSGVHGTADQVPKDQFNMVLAQLTASANRATEAK